MIERRFSAWQPWISRSELEHLKYPGVYAVARSELDLTGRPFKLSDFIIYFGMTNSVGGLTGRLRQFDETISGRRLSHGGADRVRYRFPGYNHLARRLYVAVAHFKCSPASSLPADLRKMGEVARFEYLCFAAYAEKFCRLPLFNDMSAPKFSHKSEG
jgi:hypothetical protein